MVDIPMNKYREVRGSPGPAHMRGHMEGMQAKV
jgi:hypothetical protein